MTNDATTGNAPAGEWLFQSGGQVFGPVTASRLVDLLAAGTVGPATQVASDGGPWLTLETVPQFAVALKKAQARARVEAEVSAIRTRARRNAALRWAGIGAVVAVLVVVAARAASFAAVERPWKRNALLEDLGAPITIGSVVIGRGSPREDEVLVPMGAPHRGPVRGDSRSRHAGTMPGLSRRADATDGRDALVLAQYDPARITATVARQQGSLATCVREEAQRSPDLRGEIPIEFAVGNDGKVSALWIHDPRFKTGAMHECMLRKLREWSFDRFPGERPIVSLAFRIGER